MNKNSPFLDSYKNNRNKFCGIHSATTTEKCPNGRKQRIVRINCKRYNCARCGPKRAMQIKHLITHAATAFVLNRFLTLTLNRESCAAEQSPKYIRNCWAKLRTYLKRRYGESINYISILEVHKDGYAHLHVLVDRFIPFNWIQKSWISLGGGKFVNIKLVEINRIASYLSKYLTKDLLLGDLGRKYRRVTTSRNIKLFGKQSALVWSFSKQNIDIILEQIPKVFEIDVRKDEWGIQEITVFEPKHITNTKTKEN